MTTMHGTTIVTVRKNGHVALGGRSGVCLRRLPGDPPLGLPEV